MRNLAGSVFLMVALSACGGGGGSATASTIHSVSLSWAANHETGVNSAGGGYQVLVNGRVAATIPYASGSFAPTSTTLSLATGTYSVSVRAYAALDSTGGSSGNYSVASQPILVSVP